MTPWGPPVSTSPTQGSQALPLCPIFYIRVWDYYSGPHSSLSINSLPIKAIFPAVKTSDLQRHEATALLNRKDISRAKNFRTLVFLDA